MEGGSIAIYQMGAYNMCSRCIYEIPVVDKPGILKVQVKNPLLKIRISLSVGVHQNEEGKQSRFMDGGVEQRYALFKRERLIFFGQFSYLGNPETHKQIPFTIFPLGRLKEILKYRGLFSVAKCLQSNRDV